MGGNDNGEDGYDKGEFGQIVSIASAFPHACTQMERIGHSS